MVKNSQSIEIVVLYRFHLFYRLKIRIFLNLQFSMQNRLTIGERYHFLVVVICEVNRALIQKPHYTISRTDTKSCSRIKSFLFIIFPNKIGVIYPTR